MSWESLKVTDLPNKELILIPETSDFSKALKLLIDNKILSAPVTNAGGEVTGQLDLVDLVVFVVHVSKKTQEVLVALGFVGEHETINFSDVHVDQEIQDLFRTFDTSQQIANFSKRNPLKSVGEDTSLLEIAKELTSTHRVCVMNPNKKIVNYITQSDLIKFFYTKKGLMGEKGKKTVQELSLGTCGVVTAHYQDRMVDAFKKITVKGITAVGIVDNNGKLIGDVGAHDIRVINPGSEAFVDNLVMPIQTFLASQTQRPDKVDVNTTLENVVSILESKRVHRVFVVDSDGKPLGIISLGDVIKCLV